MRNWGDFGGACLAGECAANPGLYLPDGQALGLVKSASYLLGTWRTRDGSIHRFLRSVQPYRSDVCRVFSTRDTPQLDRRPDEEAKTYGGGIATRYEGDQVTFAPAGQGGFLHTIDGDSARWEEDGLLSVSGRRAAPATQWYNPWRNGGGGLAVTSKFRAPGLVFGEEADGFFAHETHYFPRGHDFFNSPYGWGGREIHWGHFATAFEDGSSVDASLAYGPDGWGFAMLFDERGRMHVSTDVVIESELRPNGFPELIVYRFLDQIWEWRIEPKGERGSPRAGEKIIGAEGILRRQGETRKVVAAQGTIDWWLDGRAAPVVRR